MRFFKRILGPTTPPAPTDRRARTRHPVHARFPVKAVLNIVGRDDMGELLSTNKVDGWDWNARLINLNLTGVQLQMPRTILVQRGDPCRLKVEVEGFALAVPGRVAHVAERAKSLVLGLALNLDASRTQAAYLQLVDIIALGASLKRVGPLKTDGTGYLAEVFAGESESRLSVWRLKKTRAIAAIEYRLKDCVVRGLEGSPELECFAGSDAVNTRAATGAKREEILRLYQWVVLNLAPALPADVRAFLLKLAA